MTKGELEAIANRAKNQYHKALQSKKIRDEYLSSKEQHVAMTEHIKVGPQPGKQTEFLSSPADIVIYGGAAGGGKSHGLLLEPMRHYYTNWFNAVIFRRESVQIRQSGGMWDKATELYGLLGAHMKEGALEIQYGKAHLKFSHIEYEKDVLKYQGSEICMLGFDELTHFSESQFFYMLSRNRSTCGVRPYVRATCNPDPDSWVKHFIQWWIDADSGYPIEERSGVIRWFVRDNDTLVWDDTKEELIEKYKHDEGVMPKSVTFISANIHDNQILLKSDPAYLGNLKAQGVVLQERLLKGNWNIRLGAGMMFKREWFKIVKSAPAKLRKARYWDCAATEPGQKNPDPDWTAGVLLGQDEDGAFWILHLSRFRERPNKRDSMMKNIATSDGVETMVGIEQEGGASGKSQAEYFTRMFAGYNIHNIPVRKDKVTRAEPASAQAEGGNIYIVEGEWNEELLKELENFDGDQKKHDDIVDALSGALSMLTDAAPVVVDYYAGE
jgi:predicted phage terminase large subunit-like protein